MQKVFEDLGSIGLAPVIKIDDADKAAPLAKALIAGDIPCAEITFRTSAGEESMRRITREVPEILLGAGTVLTTDQVDRAAEAGAKFIVSPGFNPKVVSHCIKKRIPIIPGCSSPSDMEMALEMGLEVVKIFPAEPLGGLNYIKAVAAPYTNLKFIPTGGINASNIGNYLFYEKILACGGSWMAGPDLINTENFSEITALCKEAVKKIHGFSVAHVGINMENETVAIETASLFKNLFGFSLKEGRGSIFAGESIEIMKSPYLGKNGHIAVAVNNMARVCSYLERKGVAFNNDSAKFNEKNTLLTVYLQDEIAGFAIHLIQKKQEAL
jgi:2-dehydro-3-deoxyphosphogluconate aldolase/(4S)-4-hydroxy-2-oxoglutarate aldolase